jgi:hypothetical protein
MISFPYDDGEAFVTVLKGDGNPGAFCHGFGLVAFSGNYRGQHREIIRRFPLVLLLPVRMLTERPFQ